MTIFAHTRKCNFAPFGPFSQSRSHIYPPELGLKKTTEDALRLSYLDICISIFNGKYVTEVYDKRDSFSFDIVNFPHMSSNVPVKPAYGVYVSQLVRMARICDNYLNFKTRHLRLTSRLIQQGFWYDKLCTCFKKFSKRYRSLFVKFDVGVKRHIQQGICLPIVKFPLNKHVMIRGRRSNHS